jgi:uncharacterized membrane protein YgcG
VNKRMSRVFIAAVISCFLYVGIAFAELTLPPLTGRIVDGASLLSDSLRTEIEQKLAEHEHKTTVQIVVATVDSLQGLEIEEFSILLAEKWKIGQTDKDNGVILLVAPNERKVRIEVGYGLEPVLTDALSKLVIEKKIIPYFKASNFAGGIKEGIDELISITGDPAGEQLWKGEGAVDDRTGQLPQKTAQALNQAFAEFAEHGGFHLRAYIENNVADPDRKAMELALDWARAEEPQSRLLGYYDNIRIVMLFDPAVGRIAVTNLGYITYDNFFNKYSDHWLPRAENALNEKSLAGAVAETSADMVMLLAGVTPEWLKPIHAAELKHLERVAFLDDLATYFSVSAGVLFLFIFPFIYTLKRWQSTKWWIRIFSLTFGPPAVIAHAGMLLLIAVLAFFDWERALIMFAIWFASLFLGMVSIGILALLMMHSMGLIDLSSTGGSYSSSGYRSSSSSSWSGSSSSYGGSSGFSGGGGSFGGGGASGSW